MANATPDANDGIPCNPAAFYHWPPELANPEYAPRTGGCPPCHPPDAPSDDDGPVTGERRTPVELAAAPPYLGVCHTDRVEIMAGMNNPQDARQLVGLIPAAGSATRLGPLPMSKELYPLAIDLRGATPSPRIRVAAEYLIEAMSRGGASKAFVILRPGKWDVPAFFGDGSELGVPLAYLLVHVPFGVPFTLDQAFPFTKDATVLVGFPDIVFRPRDAFVPLIEQLDARDADVALGLFRTDEPHKVGLVECSADGWVKAIHEKSSITHLEYMWALAAWRPSFSAFLHELVRQRLPSLTEPTAAQGRDRYHVHSELRLSDVLQAAITNGLRIASVRFDDGAYIDIGTPDQLLAAIAQENGPLAIVAKSLSP